MAVVKGFSHDLAGPYSREDADRLLPILQAEGQALGLGVARIGVTVLDDTRHMFVAFCLKHRTSVSQANACHYCAREGRK